MKQLTVTFAIFCVAFLQAEWISLSESQSDEKFRTLRQTENELSIQFGLDGFEYEKISADSNEFFRLSCPLPNSGTTLEIGKPQLPVFSTFIILPDGMDAKVELEDPEYQTFENFTIYPSQHLPTEKEQEILPFVIDEKTYSKNSFYPEKTVQLGETINFRGLRMVQITLKPFRTNPKTSVLHILSSASIRVQFEKSSQSAKSANSPKSLAFENIYKSIGINYETIPARNENYQNPCYLFILPSSLSESDIEPLVEWKKEKGFEVHVANMSQIGSSENQIRQYVSDAYFGWENPPEYLCLVGDVNGSYAVPTFYETMSDGYYGEGDHPYATIDGNDDFADLFVGRLSIRTVDQLQIIMDKILNYEREPYMDNTDWYTRSLLVGDPSASGISCVITKKFCKDITIDDIPNPVEVYLGDFDAQISQNINEGVLYANYRGIWGTSDFSTGDINALTNGYMLPLATFITCGTGSFSEYTTCLGEAFLRAGTLELPCAAVASIAISTVGTHTLFNNCMDGGIYYGIFVEDIFTAGGALMRGKLNLHQNYPDNPHDYARIFSHWNNLMGDPSTELWTGIPQPLTVEYLPSISIGTQNISVFVQNELGEPLAGAWVNLYKSDENFQHLELTDEFGFAYLPVESLQNGTCKLTVTSHNQIPHLGTFEIVSEDYFVNFTEIDILDSAGNGDGFVNPGETVEFQISVQNFGCESANDIFATLSCNDSSVILGNTQSTFPNLNPGEVAIGSPLFSATFANQLNGGSRIRFALTTETANTDPITDYFWIDIAAPLIGIGTQDLTDTNGGTVSPGEIGHLSVGIFNSGDIAAEQIQAVLRANDYRIEVMDSVANYAQILPNSDPIFGDAPFTFFANPITIPGSQIPAKIIISSADGYFDVLPITLEIGEVHSYDPLGPDEYGYYCYDESDQNYISAPSYDWYEINEIGTNTYISDTADNMDESKIFALPFTFQFYGVEYDTITICSNGWLSFGDTGQSTFRNWVVPGPLGPAAMIAAFWDDLMTSPGAIYYHFDETQHLFIVEWDNLRTYFAESVETFQIILYDPAFYPTPTGDGEIVIQYNIFNNTTSGDYEDFYQIHGNYCTVGLEDHTNTVGLQYSFNNTYPTAAATLGNHTAIKFTTVGNEMENPPSATVSADELNFAMGNSEEIVGSFQISNNGEGILSYNLQVNFDDEPGDHGPDNFGHYWSSSDENSEIEPEWIDISDTGIEVNFGHNDQAPTERFPIGFPFQFYGTEYAEFLVNPNGWIGFEDDNSGWQNLELPNSNAPKSAMMVFWDDLNPQSTGGSGTAKYNSSAEQCIIQFDEFTHWNGAGPFTFQIVLSPDGSFAFNYLNIGTGDFSTTIGIQNANASDALQLAYNQNFASDNLTIKFSTAKQWIQVEPQNGIVASGASATIEYSVNSVSLSDGNYNALLLLGTNDPENPLFQIPVTLSVNGNCAGWQLGDPTNDSTINVLDVVMVIGFALNQEEPNLCQIYASDFNSDGNINVLDVIQIVGEILGD